MQPFWRTCCNSTMMMIVHSLIALMFSGLVMFTIIHVLKLYLALEMDGFLHSKLHSHGMKAVIKMHLLSHLVEHGRHTVEILI